jgi:CP family cyanate transporter-like MFS transporter
VKRLEPAWLVILAGVCAALHVGKLPAALPALHESLGVSLMQAGFLLSLVQFAGMMLGVAAGLFADRIGLRRTMLIGLWILAAASALGSASDRPMQLLTLRAVEGLGFLLVTMPAPGLIRRLVAPGRLSARLGWWGTFMPLGTALALLGGPWVIGRVGWTGLWLALAVGTALVAWLLANGLSPDAPTAHSGAGAAGWSTRLRQTLSSRGPWLVALFFALYSAQWIAVIGFLPSIYIQAGLASGLTALATAIAAAVNIVGNVTAGHLLQRGVRADRLLLAGYAVMGLGAWLAFGPVASGLPGVGAAAMRYGAVVLFSMVGGLIPGTLFSLAVRLAPSDGTVSTTVGWMQQGSALGQFAGPPLVAWVASDSGDWGGIWWVTSSCAVVGLALALIARRWFQPGQRLPEQPLRP